MRLAQLLVLGVVGLHAGSVLAQNAATAPSSFDIPHEKYVLDNGLEVILHQDLTLPMVAVNIWYHVGPVNEPPDRSGFAHLFEHLMFEGSKHAGNQFDYLLESVGGTNMNGTTSWDRTNYYETVPAEHLELALWLEADRMGFMIDTLSAERLEVQREVVKNERRESYENQPYGPSSLALYNALFPEGHPYHGAIIGSMEDLSKASMDDVAAFFRDFYAPGNATVVLAGHFDTGTAKQLIDKHFATLPAGSGKPAPRTGAAAPTQGAPTLRLTVEEDVQLSQVTLAWHAPPAFSVDEPALEIASRILGSGKASRLYQSLIATGLANDAGSSLDSNQLGSILTVFARAASGKSLAQVEAALVAELQRLMQQGPTEGELTRAKNGIIVEYASQLQRLNAYGGEGGRAGLLQRLNHYRGNATGLGEWVESHQRVDARAVQAVLAKYLHPDRAIVVATVPRGTNPKEQPDTEATTPPADPANGKPEQGKAQTVTEAETAAKEPTAPAAGKTKDQAPPKKEPTAQ